jgi:hypothetical protein
MNLGAGLVTVAGAAGVTVNGAATLPQYSSATLVRTASDAWTIYTSSSAWDRRVQVEEQQTAGTHGGTFTTGAWRTRTLNTSMINNVAGASLASSQLTLPAGTYAAEAFAAVGVNVGVHQTRLQDITGAATLLTGLVLRAPTAGSAASGIGPSSLAGEFTLTTSSAIELQHQCSVTEATDRIRLCRQFHHRGLLTTHSLEIVMEDIRRGLEILTPGALWDWSVPNEGGDKAAYDAIVWEDERAKPAWADLVKAIKAAEKVDEANAAAAASNATAAVAHAKSLGFTDAMISAMYPGLVIP